MNPLITTWVTEPPITPALSLTPSRHRNATWMPWVGRNRLATPVEELEFVEQLGVFAGDSLVPFRRSDVTAVLNALRCGLRIDELFDKAPGLQPARLFAAYHHLEQRRTAANVAWTSITIAGRIEVFDEHRAEAATLLPSLVTRLDEVAVESPDEFDLVVLQLAAAVASTGAAARRIERVIEAAPDDSERAVELGRVLYNLTGAGVTSRPDFLPHRVGALVPARVAALLGEEVGESENCTRARRR